MILLIVGCLLCACSGFIIGYFVAWNNYAPIGVPKMGNTPPPPMPNNLPYFKDKPPMPLPFNGEEYIMSRLGPRYPVDENGKQIIRKVCPIK